MEYVYDIAVNWLIVKIFLCLVLQHASHFHIKMQKLHQFFRLVLRLKFLITGSHVMLVITLKCVFGTLDTFDLFLKSSVHVSHGKNSSYL